ncbi:MAG: hypothetical protein ACI8Q9_000840, partial [Planctomycetota bacterium]
HFALARWGLFSWSDKAGYFFLRDE